MPPQIGKIYSPNYKAWDKNSNEAEFCFMVCEISGNVIIVYVFSENKTQSLAFTDGFFDKAFKEI